LRIIFPGAVYHIGARGYERSFIFKDDKEKQHFLDILTRASKKYDFIIHAYAIMGNHYHILAETSSPNLSQVMHYINMRYGKYYNIRHKRKGYVFERRYSAFIIQKGEAVKRQVQYIHMNPIRAKIESVLGTYKWTSHNRYVGIDKESPSKCDYVLSLFGGDTKTAIAGYEEYMCKSKVLNKVRVETGMYGVGIIGDKSFVKNVKLLFANKKLPEEINIRSKIKKIFDYEEIIRAVCEFYQITEVLLTAKKGAWNVYKKVLIYLLSADGGLSGAEIGRMLEMHQSSVSKAISRMEKQIKAIKGKAEEMNKIRIKYTVLKETLIK
ncbi:MAG TPA: transposase, partial [Candidatus Goldiibacteriota bacterium]|nr:transposase [Candidatus Goldiibacteriota bacterium]